MRIVDVIRDCFDTMTVMKSFVNETSKGSNVVTDNTECPFLVLYRPLKMSFRYAATSVQEVYDILLIYGNKSSNTDLGNSQNANDIELEILLQQAKIMVLNLDRHPVVRSVEITQPWEDDINFSDLNAAVILQYLKITLLPPSPDVCATLPRP
jgi:hypothetical protein